MPYYFLIDTDVWVWLMSNPKSKKYLNHLKKLVSENTIRILIPEALVKEWENQKVLRLKDIERTFRAAYNYSPEEIISEQLNTDLSAATEKAGMIDELFKNGVQITISNAVKVETMDRYAKDLPPFHVKRKSNSDCLIYLSSVEYLVDSEIAELVFLSINHTDFCDPTDLKKIHPLLKKDKVETKYYKSVEHCLHDLGLQPPTNPDSLADTTEDDIIDFQIGKQYSLLDRLHKVLTLVREQIPFVPLNILVRIDPFRLDQVDRNTHYTNFTLYTNNKALVEFFKKIEINGSVVLFKEDAEYKNTAENIEKLKFIIKTLNNNLVLEIGSISYSDSIDIRLEEKTGCDCLSCNYKNLKFERALTKIFDGKDEDKQEKAFIAYQFGFYIKSLELYYEIYKSAVAKKQNILKHRMQYHLRWVSGFTGTRNNATHAEILKEIKSFNMEKEFHSLFYSSAFDRKVSAFFYDSIFNYHYTTEINDILEHIRDNYDLQLRAGFSSNQNYWTLLGLYAEFESFVIGNNMPFTKYSNFTKLSEKFIEGIFLTYALNQYQPSRLKYFTDFHLAQILFNGSPEKIFEFYNHYVQKRIKNTSDYTPPEFEQKVYNYFAGSAEYLASPRSEKRERKTLELDHGKYFWNIISILTVIQFDKAFIRKCGNLIFTYIQATENIMLLNLKYLRSFLILNGRVLGKPYLQKVFRFFISNPTFHNDSLFASFSRIQGIKTPVLISTKKDFECVTKIFLQKCTKCGSSHFESLFEIYSLMTKPLQEKVAGIIEHDLTQTFDHKMYYRASIQGVIDYRKFFKAYLQIFATPSKGWKDHPFFLAGEIEHPELSQLINLVFKNKIRLPEEFIERVKGYSEYYEWLLDMKNFDYGKFNPLWVIQYRTRYYLETLFKNKQVKEKVKQYLRNNPQPVLAKDYAMYVN